MKDHHFFGSSAAILRLHQTCYYMHKYEQFQISFQHIYFDDMCFLLICLLQKISNQSLGLLITRELPGVARVKKLMGKKGNCLPTLKFKKSFMYDTLTPLKLYRRFKLSYGQWVENKIIFEICQFCHYSFVQFGLEKSNLGSSFLLGLIFL